MLKRLRRLLWRLLGSRTQAPPDTLKLADANFGLAPPTTHGLSVRFPDIETTGIETQLHECPVIQIDLHIPRPKVEGKVLFREPKPRPVEPKGRKRSHEARTARTPTEPSLLTDDLYALLLPPAEDLAEFVFEWPSDLYDFQIEGAQFLASRRHALLADDMGLGKTVQSIAALRLLLAAGWVHKALVVCPAGLKRHWKNEIEHWAPEMRAVTIDGSEPARRAKWRQPCQVHIVNYEALWRDIDDLGRLPHGYVYDIVILDEAQRIKNPSTKTAQACRRIPRDASWCLTGTPLENRVDDLVSIFRFVHPELRLENRPTWSLRDTIEPYFLRRRKGEVLDQLPPKIITDRWLTLTPAQSRAYKRAETEGIAVDAGRNGRQLGGG